MNRLRVGIAAIAVLLPMSLFAQRPTRATRANADLQRAADVIQEWGKLRAAEGNRACHLQAVLNELIEVDRSLDPMQPNVSISKAIEHLAAANKAMPIESDMITFRLRSLLIIAGQIFDPHLSPDIPSQQQRFAHEVLDPAYRMVTPEVMTFVEVAQTLESVLHSISQTQSDVSAMIVHAIHGDCDRQQR